MSHCIKCSLPATFFTPENFCDEHWIDWWMEGYEADGYTKEELKEIRRVCREDIQRSRDIVAESERERMRIAVRKFRDANQPTNVIPLKDYIAARDRKAQKLLTENDPEFYQE